ncbi:hypothetical protein FHS29_004437 [Saccharothrix tamanrassetensis]|uniref:Uncharacterized protein n=1 Tax=Saccharothrix tamanrassetensis TaxID=1051531 RepID=A0A841CH24_9PSEU|nr:hypothetical protein [Saccharothrix tamanrassetensis]MBB5957842.1 hypothetical protein [Saccharothrix tamanrassetensis]
MEVPEHRALLGVDVVGSARNEGYHLNTVHGAVAEMVRDALATAGIGRADVVEWEPTGDGALLTLPSRRLGAVLDAAHHLDGLAAQHNRHRKPDIRLRLAVEIGPVGAQPGLYAPKIALSRLLNASVFKELVARCDGMNTALIVSDGALRAVFGGDYTRHVRRTDFSPLAVRDKEFADTAWVRVPGCDPHKPGPAEPPASPPGGRVVNVVNGSFNGVQAGEVHGGIHLG